MALRLTIIPALLCATSAAMAATDTMTGIFDSRIRTLQTCVEGDELAPPLIVLGSDDRLVVSFDELAEDHRYLRYNLTHCDMRWQPDQLVDTEFLDGFNESTIDCYSYSRATSAHYVHYRITLPDSRMTPLVSGNYLLRVYDENDPDKTLLQTRFMVVEPRVGIDSQVTTVTDIDYNDAHQQLAIAVDTDQSGVRDPFNDLTVVVSQNGRADNEHIIGRPQRVAGSRVIYEHLPGLIFEAGNEYRRFETVSTSYAGMGVDAISYAAPYYHFALLTDSPRSDSRYDYDETQAGRYVVREYNSTDSDTEADYGVVHFSLASPRLANTDIYIDGDLTLRRFDDSSRMEYNDVTGCYEKVMLLKQGSYNYQYLTVGPRDRQGHTSLIEGDYHPTRNQYLIRVYERKPGERYDRLIGVNALRAGGGYN